MLFQSHAGSIEAASFRPPRPRTGDGFNPTLVRLRPDAPTHPRSQCAGFNPTLVRLRRKPRPHQGGEKLSFNPTLVRLRQRIADERFDFFSCFNPTLVRLRRDGTRGKGSRVVAFQSHAGSIEAGSWIFCVSTAYRGFNPTLVRLRPPISIAQKGRISTVSIPRWFD